MSAVALPPPPPPSGDSLAVIDALLDKRPVPPDAKARLAAPELVAERAAREARQREEDWAGLARYRDANAAAASAPDMVMIGDSLTEIWGLAMPDLFGGAIANRGIGGQTSQQILLRFVADVIELRPRRVHILCGTNDIAGNNGPNLPDDFQRNIRAMVDLAAANGIAAIFASIPPASTIFWSPDARPLEWIPVQNAWLRDFAARRGLTFLDYHALLHDGQGGLQEHYSADGVHVTRAAYAVMKKLLADASLI